MSIDRLQSKIRKMKCPVVLDFQLDVSVIPAYILGEEKTVVRAFSRYVMELMEALRDRVPAVRFHFSDFALHGSEGVSALSAVLAYASKLGYYTLLNAPEALSAQQAVHNAGVLLGEDCNWKFDGLVLSQFIGTDAIKPYVSRQKEGDKGLFAIVRTGNKSGPEMQDLLTGGRLVHIAQADLVHRIAEPNLGKSGYCTLGVMASATNAASLMNLRSKFKYLFILIDGFDAANANSKNCIGAFDKLGHGAAICVGHCVTGAWKDEEEGTPFAEAAQQAVERINRNISRYITVL